jgi:hypothetical protein
MRDVGEVIAQRTLTLRQRGKRSRKIVVRLGKPQVFTEGNPDYFCPFQILGLGGNEVRFAAGVDPFQALQLVLIKIAIDLHIGYRRKFGQAFYWLEKGDNLGFAEPVTGAGTETYQPKRRRPRRKD